MAAARATDGAVQGGKVGRLRCRAQTSAEVPGWDAAKHGTRASAKELTLADREARDPSKR